MVNFYAQHRMSFDENCQGQHGGPSAMLLTFVQTKMANEAVQLVWEKSGAVNFIKKSLADVRLCSDGSCGFKWSADGVASMSGGIIGSPKFGLSLDSLSFYVGSLKASCPSDNVRWIYHHPFCRMFILQQSSVVYLYVCICVIDYENCVLR